MKNIAKTSLLLIISAIIGGAISVGIYKMTENDNTNLPNDKNTKFADYTIEQINLPTFDFSEIADKINPTVVHIKTKVVISGDNSNMYDNHPFFEFFGPRSYNMPRMGSGSGVIISEDGYIITNNHVIDDAEEIEVNLNDKRKFNATIIGRDPQTDLAVIKIEADDLPYLKYGNSDDLKVGEWVLAVGNPFNLTSTVTAGIVSAKARSIGILGRGSAVESFIQTDAAVNPGNSGGALVNVNGELIGINTAIASKTGSYEGYSFAIPINLAEKVVKDIIEFGKVQRGFLGVSITEVTQDIARKNNVDEIQGVYIADVMKDGAADEAGIKKDDIIIKIGDREVNSVPELQEAVSMNRPGDEIAVLLLRNGKEKEFDVTLKDLKGNTEIVESETSKYEDIIGAQLENLTKNQLSKLGLDNGVIVTYVGPGKFKSAGIPKNFIITKIDKKEVKDVEDVYEIISKSEDGVLIEGIEPDGSKGYYGFGIN